MNGMILHRIINLFLTLSTAICGLVAAIYWYLSSLPEANISSRVEASYNDAPGPHILEAQVNLYSVQGVLQKASRLNKLASIWSALAAALGAIASIVSIF
jgi:hypothetical protein